ncbi:MAG: hypothetical protein UX02_C0004G0013 [Candidatus Moranbacteria bacterium GW2011_GWC1_45_18]|nr:MAG: hypothetical protein UT79_C0003G0076 [Candidatus Moranbacteria bacterium GW2011_GWC2_40_12]KKT33297.1 MAG: hypothetical protein UW19_C0010G0038 [Candidatus Moranbacteria bacterium GW2011_GWF2_44_10]KKT71558.1 MAG: hypothetical protein UW66_C0028G0007 [Candidatus Moranbacteria bacterium GW2011_GWF1_44_4]KKT99293.1 MAG: hypothetical protein UX02_C0004G0013 [Candidatus Moranbacteria bacterium GW2011_GWC1_45_18]OGI24127.1 MAG: hypothetical protein A2194_02430 [Candidatus Moranbacteria bacte
MNNLEKARETEENALDNLKKSRFINEKINNLDAEQLANLEEELQTRRALVSAELINIENELKAIGEVMFEKNNSQK